MVVSVIVIFIVQVSSMIDEDQSQSLVNPNEVS